jgi:hypothetical protein
MVLPILVLPAALWHSVEASQPIERNRPVDLFKTKQRMDAGPRWQPSTEQRHRAKLLRHWMWTAAQCAPAPLPPMVVETRASAGGRNLLSQCEALLRHLARRRRDALGLSRNELVQVATGFDGHTLRVPSRSVAAHAFVMSSMYWDGHRHPLALFAPPLHPPTGLVRWLMSFTVQDQVDHGQSLLTQLAREEQRMFEFALRLTTRIDALTANRARGLVLLPELLKVAETPNVGQRDGFTTSTHEESTTYDDREPAPCIDSG